MQKNAKNEIILLKNKLIEHIMVLYQPKEGGQKNADSIHSGKFPVHKGQSISKS